MRRWLGRGLRRRFGFGRGIGRGLLAELLLQQGQALLDIEMTEAGAAGRRGRALRLGSLRIGFGSGAVA